jgi:hypothetical protein
MMINALCGDTPRVCRQGRRFCWSARESLVVTAGSGRRGYGSADADRRVGVRKPILRSTVRRCGQDDGAELGQPAVAGAGGAA